MSIIKTDDILLKLRIYFDIFLQYKFKLNIILKWIQQQQQNKN